MIGIGLHGAGLLWRRAVVCPLRDWAGSELGRFRQKYYYDADVVCRTMQLGQLDKALAHVLEIPCNKTHSCTSLLSIS